MTFYELIWQGEGVGDAGDLEEALLNFQEIKPKELSWEQVFADSDACVTPVLEMTEAPDHPHLAARGTFVVDPVSGERIPGPAPRFGPRNS